VHPPDVPGPDECASRSFPDDAEDSIMRRLDVRLASARDWDDVDGGPMPGGRSTLWARTRDGVDLASGAGLAILGDYVPFGIRQALGRPGGGNSLDNTLRVYRLAPTEWVMLDIRIHGVAHGIGHGVVHLWSDDGTLLATASQSAIVRIG
jgi:acyl-CoA thioesterase II